MHEEDDGVAVKLFPFLVGLTCFVVSGRRVCMCVSEYST